MIQASSSCSQSSRVFTSLCINFTRGSQAGTKGMLIVVCVRVRGFHTCYCVYCVIVVLYSDPIQREGVMDGHHSVHLPCLLSGTGTLVQLASMISCLSLCTDPSVWYHVERQC